VLDVGSTLICLYSTIQTQILPTHHLQEVFHDIHDLCHLEEDENLCETLVVAIVSTYRVGTDSVACSKELGKDACQKLNLPRRLYELVIDHTARIDLVLDALKQEQMLTYLPKLHQLVTQALHTGTFSANNVIQYP
jgi:hypothetical protein